MQSSLLNRIFNLYKKSPRIAILMSGTGSNADTILKNINRYPSLNFITICTDQSKSNALKLSQQYGLDYFCHEGSIATIAQREHYFETLAKYLREMRIDTLIYAGFLKISPQFFVTEFPSINVHPADLTILNDNGLPKYVGMHAIKEAICNGETYIASTAHVVDCHVDCGTPIMISKPLSLHGKNKDNITSIHELLKINCEHLLYPCILELLSNGVLSTQEVPYQWHTLTSAMKKTHGDYFSDKLLSNREMTSPIDLAYLSQVCSADVGFDFTTIDDVMAKVKEEFTELTDAFNKRQLNVEHFLEEIGDCFFSLVNLCRFLKLHPDDIIDKNVLKYLNRCNRIEKKLKSQNRLWSDVNNDDIALLWKEAKKHEHN